MKKESKHLKKISKKFLERDHVKKISKLKTKEDKIESRTHLIVSKLKLKFHELEIKFKEHPSKKNLYIESRMLSIPSKIEFFSQSKNKKDFKKILILFDEIETEIKNV